MRARVAAGDDAVAPAGRVVEAVGDRGDGVGEAVVNASTSPGWRKPTSASIVNVSRRVPARRRRPASGRRRARRRPAVATRCSAAKRSSRGGRRRPAASRRVDDEGAGVGPQDPLRAAAPLARLDELDEPGRLEHPEVVVRLLAGEPEPVGGLGRRHRLVRAASSSRRRTGDSARWTRSGSCTSVIGVVTASIVDSTVKFVEWADRRPGAQAGPMRVIATAGHVDHGKSSLVLALTGTDPDRFAEEKRRGLTIDLGFAHAVVGGEALSFVDVPGHVRFLRNMLAGVGGVDACLFVVAATEGWKPQSEEHLRILELVGVRHGVVALTKVDVARRRRARRAGRARGRRPRRRHVPRRRADRARRRAVRASASTTSPAALGRPRPDDAGGRAIAAGPGCGSTACSSARGSGTVVTGTLTDGSIATGDQRRRRARRAARPGCAAIQTLGAAVARDRRPATASRSTWPASSTRELARGDAVVAAGPVAVDRRGSTPRSTVLASLDHAVSRRGAYLAYIGSGEHAVRLRVLGPESLGARARPGSCGCTSPSALPLLPGDRYVLRETGRDETVGGGEVLDVAPVLPASRARPDRSVDRVVAERGWVDADELELLTGERRPPTVGRWVADAGASCAATAASLAARLDAAGPLGLELAPLDERERAVLATLDGVVVDGASARRAGGADPLADHPVVAALAAGGLAPPAPDGIDRAELRELARRGVLVERDGLWFHADAVDDGRRRWPPACSRERPDGFTVGEFREAAGITRKHAVPLLAELDARGVTRRRDDLRIAGTPPPGGFSGVRSRLARSGGSESGQADSRRRRRSSWFRPPQMP